MAFTSDVIQQKNEQVVTMKGQSLENWWKRQTAGTGETSDEEFEDELWDEIGDLQRVRAKRSLDKWWNKVNYDETCSGTVSMFSRAVSALDLHTDSRSQFSGWSPVAKKQGMDPVFVIEEEEEGEGVDDSWNLDCKSPANPPVSNGNFRDEDTPFMNEDVVLGPETMADDDFYLDEARACLGEEDSMLEEDIDAAYAIEHQEDIDAAYASEEEAKSGEGVDCNTPADPPVSNGALRDEEKGPQGACASRHVASKRNDVVHGPPSAPVLLDQSDVAEKDCINNLGPDAAPTAVVAAFLGDRNVKLSSGIAALGMQLGSLRERDDLPQNIQLGVSTEKQDRSKRLACDTPADPPAPDEELDKDALFLERFLAYLRIACCSG